MKRTAVAGSRNQVPRVKSGMNQFSEMTAKLRATRTFPDSVNSALPTPPAPSSAAAAVG